NKSDLVEEVIISEEEIMEAAEEYGFHHITTSAKTGENVNDAFLYIALKFLEKA
ncbi:MAG: GTP-binding protein, partial [Promethearchaeia archaeon]